MKSLEYLATRNAGRFDIVEKDGPRTVFRLALDNGASGIVEDWELFEGVNLTFNDIPHGSLTWKSSEPRSRCTTSASSSGKCATPCPVTWG